MEIEAKFSIPNRQVFRDFARLRALAGYQLVPGTTVKVVDRYVDTADGRMLAGGYAMRLRQEGDTLVATLKGLGGADGAVHRRAELEVSLPQWSANPTEWPESSARTLAESLSGGAELQPLVELAQRRARSNVMDGTRRVAELSLDAVRAVVGRRPALYYEVEIELRPDGAESDLAAIARELSTEWGLAPEPLSKFDRALATLRARGTAVEGRLTAEERAALIRCSSGSDPELARRALVVLGWGDGLPTREIVARSGLSDSRVRFWLREFRSRRLGILQADEPARLAGAVVQGPPAEAGQVSGRDDGASQSAAPPGIRAGPKPPVRKPLKDETGPAAILKDAQDSGPRSSIAAHLPSSTRAQRALPSVIEFCRENGVDLTHARHVAKQARILFDGLRTVHHLPRKLRGFVKVAAHLYTIGVASAPERPHLVGRDLVLAQPLRNVSTAERLALACVVALNRNKVRPEREPAMEALDDKIREQVLAATALLRIADALDFSHTQGTLVVGVECVDGKGCEVTVDGPSAEVDASRARSRAKFWSQLFDQELTLRVQAEQSGPVHRAIVEPATATRSKEPMEAPLPPAIPPVKPDEPMSEAGRKVLYLHFTRMLANEASTRLGADIEGLHDMRVSARRMRAAFQLYEPYFDKKALDSMVRRLRRAGRALGAVRDLDVLLAGAQGYEAKLPDEQKGGLEQLFSVWRARREVARRVMLEMLDGRGYRELRADCEAFLTTPGAGVPARGPEPGEPYEVRHVLPGLIFDRYGAVRAYETFLPDAPLDTYHALRIDCKRFRYAMEFSRDVLGPQTSALIKQAVAMQDHLGAMQDARVAEGLLIEFIAQERAKARRKNPSLALDGVESYLALQRSTQADLLARFPEAWAQLIGSDYRQALAKVLAAL